MKYEDLGKTRSNGNQETITITQTTYPVGVSPGISPEKESILNWLVSLLNIAHWKIVYINVGNKIKIGMFRKMKSHIDLLDFFI